MTDEDRRQPVVLSREKRKSMVDADHAWARSRPGARPAIRQRRAAHVENYTILKGIFPEETGKQIDHGQIRFCHIDVDVYQSAKDVFDWVWPRVPVGGIVVFDDYGFATCSGVTKFVNEQNGRQDIILIHNLNGHAILMKIQ